MSQLNPQQQAAVRYIDGPLLVLAGAGSGKTSVISNKISYLIETCNIAPRHIAAVTFTNKAAREMKQRVTGLLESKSAKGLTVSTFHNLGLNFIRSERKAFGFKAGFSIFDAEDSRTLIKELTVRDSDLDADHIDRIQHQISHWKNALESPERAFSKAESKGEQAIALIYRRYCEALRAYNAVDFDDLIMLPVTLLQTDGEIRRRWQAKLHYLLVDEYQDTNAAQYELIRLLSGDRNAITVVGDDDQSIYAWRGARPENMAQLKTDFPDLQVIKLEQNYRSTARILDAANSLIANNPHLFEKSLWSDLGFGDPIRLTRCANEEAEAEHVVNEILNMRIEKRCHFRDFAVLYRGNHQARILEMKLQSQGVPYQLSGGTSFFSRTEIKDIMGYLRLMVNPDDDNALLRIINTPRRGIGAATLEKLGAYANRREISLYAAIGEFGMQETLTPQQQEPLEHFKLWFDRVTGNCLSGEPISALREMLDDIDYQGWLYQNTSSDSVAENRMRNIHLLFEQLARTIDDAEQADSLDADGSRAIESAIAKLVVRDLLDRQEEESANDKVQLMTLHASKGLEFPHVFMIGMEEALLPHRSSIEEGNIEEERRLTYVGVTRARQTLNMTLAGKRRQYGETSATIPSRFLDEIPEHHMERYGFGDSTPEQQKQRGKESLDSLKELFA